jgi:hypothetical protein
MSENRFPVDLSQNLIPTSSLNGIRALQRLLERHCFGEVKIQQWLGEPESIGLVIDVNCPISLGEMLKHFEMGSWGRNTNEASAYASFSALSRFQDVLSCSNGQPLDIEEFTIQLTDCLLVLQKTTARSISQNWVALFEAIAAHYRDFTCGGSAVPEEMYCSIRCEQEGPQIPSNYWALYFPEDCQGWIYDLRERRLSKETIIIHP